MPGRALTDLTILACRTFVLILADNLGWGELGCYGGGALRVPPRRASTGSLPKACDFSTST